MYRKWKAAILREISPEMVERIIHLNACLFEAATWITKRARFTRDAYIAGGGAADEQQRGDHWEDFELEAVIKCSLDHDSLEFKPDDEHANMIAVVTSSQKQMHELEDDDLTWSDCGDGQPTCEGARVSPWAEGLPFIEAFRQIPFCYLFHEVYDHTLRLDIDALLKIGEVEINLVLIRQRGIALETGLLPRQKKRSYPRSVFKQTPCSHADKPLAYRDLRYARLLNQKMSEAQTWIEEQARRGEKEYLMFGELDSLLTTDNAYEDYEMMMEVRGCLGENHPEYDENEDGILVRYSAPILKKNMRVFGRTRNILRRNRYGCSFPPSLWRDDYSKLQPCGLFWDILDRLEHDWLKMLSIGELLIDVSIVQRHIIQV